MEPDKYGHCCICHKNMLIKQVINNKVQQRFTADYVEKEFLLDDGSRMRVAMCVDCKAGYREQDNKMVMDCIIKGWEDEVNGFKHWTEEKKKDYLDRYSKRYIITCSDGMKDDILKDKVKEHHIKKRGKEWA